MAETGIVRQQQIPNTERDIGQPRLVAGSVKRERIRMINDVGRVTGFAGGFLQQ